MRHQNKRKALSLLGAALLCTVPIAAAAQQSDSSQPIVVTADRSEHSEALQRQVLTGNVVIEQGSLVIHADKVVIFLKQGELDRVDASGAPARYQQLDDAGQLVKGRSLQVEYSAVSGQLTLIGEAQLENATQSVKGERIDYNVNTQAAEADGGNERVNIVIQPAKNGQE